MIDIEYYFRGDLVTEIGNWLDCNMPNPPVDEQQRWTFGEANDGTNRSGIRFFNDEDATLFLLRWQQVK